MRVSIGTETHFLDQLGYMPLGVAVARRAWLAKAEVMNTWPFEKLAAWTRRHPRDRSPQTPRAAAARS